MPRSEAEGCIETKRASRVVSIRALALLEPYSTDGRSLIFLPGGDPRVMSSVPKIAARAGRVPRSEAEVGRSPNCIEAKRAPRVVSIWALAMLELYSTDALARFSLLVVPQRGVRNT